MNVPLLMTFICVIGFMSYDRPYKQRLLLLIYIYIYDKKAFRKSFF